MTYKLYKGYRIYKDGTIHNKDGTVKKLGKNSSGYYRVDLFTNGKREREFVHRLVARLFIPSEKGKNIVNHLDGNKLNNNYKNLRWTTHSENNKHAYDRGLKKPVKNHSFNAKLTRNEVSIIKKMLKGKLHSQAEVARRFGVTRYTINKISIGETWKDVI